MANSQTPSLIVCGLEGVLAPGMGSASQSCDLTAAQLYSAVGGHLTIFTQRSPAAVRAALGGSAVNLPVAACGGAVLYNLQKDCLFQSRAIMALTGRELIRFAMDNLTHPGIIGVDELGRTRLLCASREAQMVLNREGGAYDVLPMESAGDRWCKLVICAGGHQIEKIQEHLENNPDLPVSVMRQDAYSIELVSSRVSPEETMERLCALAGCEQQQTTAVVVQEYDLGWAQYTGEIVALGDASDEVKNSAQKVLGTYRSGSMAEYLYGHAAAMQQL